MRQRRARRLRVVRVALDADQLRAGELFEGGDQEGALTAGRFEDCGRGEIGLGQQRADLARERDRGLEVAELDLAPLFPRQDVRPCGS